jgi:hypothetical protein
MMKIVLIVGLIWAVVVALILMFNAGAHANDDVDD